MWGQYIDWKTKEQLKVNQKIEIDCWHSLEDDTKILKTNRWQIRMNLKVNAYIHSSYQFQYFWDKEIAITIKTGIG